MNAKQAEAATGISRRNLRFYEQQGLITPERNPENDYRDYSSQDIEALKLIRTLRMLDVPLEDIKQCLQGTVSLTTVSQEQEKRLLQKEREVQTAIKFCRELSKEQTSIDSLLEKMQEPVTEKQLFADWKKDYLLVENAEALKFFRFTPDEEITNPRQFTDALFAYAQEQNLDLVITKEGMYPEFTIDGIEYTAERVYRHMGYVPFPVAVVNCRAEHPEMLEPDMPKGKRTLLSLFRNWWWVLPILVPELIVCIRGGMPFWGTLLLVTTELVMFGVLLFPFSSTRS